MLRAGRRKAHKGEAAIRPLRFQSAIKLAAAVALLATLPLFADVISQTNAQGQQVVIQRDAGGWYCHLAARAPNSDLWAYGDSCTADSLPLVICRAALSAVEAAARFRRPGGG